MNESRAQRERRLAAIHRMNPLAQSPETELFLIEQSEQTLSPATQDTRDIERAAARKAELRQQVKQRDEAAAVKKEKDAVTTAEQFGNWLAVNGMQLDSTGSDDFMTALNAVAHEQRDPKFDELDQTDAAGAELMRQLIEAGLSPEERAIREDTRQKQSEHAALVERDFRKQAREAAQAREDEAFLAMSRRQQDRYLRDEYRKKGYGRPVPDDAA
jgi:hypothetical protein